VRVQHRQGQRLLQSRPRRFSRKDLQGEPLQNERRTRRTEDRSARRGNAPPMQQVRAYLKKPNLLFQKCIDMKEGSSRLEEAIKNEIINERYIPELKIEHEDDKDNYLAVQPMSMPAPTKTPTTPRTKRRRSTRTTSLSTWTALRRSTAGMRRRSGRDR
jgi:hypothetical protein